MTTGMLSWFRRVLGGESDSRSVTWDDLMRMSESASMVASGVSVTNETALTVPDVYACLNVLSQDVGRAPLKLRVKESTSEWTDAEQHPLWEILHELTNPETTATEFRRDMTWNLLRSERAYAEIVRNVRGEVVSMWTLDPDRMTVTRDALGVKRYSYRVEHGGQPITWAFNPDRPPILELRYPSPIVRCRELIGLALAVDRYGAKFFGNGARLSGILSSPGPMKPEARQALREEWAKMYSGAENAHRTGVTEGGLTFTPMTSPNDEAQFNETRAYLRTQIAGAFRVPPHKIGDLARATFSNIEAQDRDYVNASLNPLLVLWEQALRRDLLTTRQYPRYRAIFDREALIEADSQSRAQALAVGRQNGWYSANDVRRKLHENPNPASDGGDLYHQNGSFALLTGPSNPSTPVPAKGDSEPVSPSMVM